MALLYKRFFTTIANGIDPDVRRKNLAVIGTQVEAITTELPGVTICFPGGGCSMRSEMR